MFLRSATLHFGKLRCITMLFRFWVFPDCTFLDISISSKSYRHNAVPNRFSSHLSTSLTNGPRSLSRVKAGTHSALLKGSHTVAHTAKQGPSLPRPQRGLVLPAISLLFHHAFIYIHFPVLCEPSTPAEENNPAKLPHKFYPPTVSHPDF